MNRQQVPWLRVIVFDFLSERKNEVVNCSGCWKVLIAPNVIQQHFPRHDFTFVQREVFHDFKFPRREFERLFLLRCRLLLEVNLHIAEHVVLNFLFDRRLSPEQRMDAGDQFTNAERLRHVIVGTDLQTQHLVHFLSPFRQHEDWNIDAVVSQIAANIYAILVRQNQIENDQVNVFSLGNGETSGAGGAGENIEVFCLQNFLNSLRG